MIKWGLKIPIQFDGQGRLATVRAGDQLQKLIMIALSDHTNSNPFLSQFPNLGLIGQIDNTDIENQVRDAVTKLFDDLNAEDRASLKSLDIVTKQDGTLEANVIYQDEEQSEQSVTIHLGDNAAGGLEVANE